MLLWIFQSTLPARGATTIVRPQMRSWIISIHAPRTGSDSRLSCSTLRCNKISIHAPRTGSDTLFSSHSEMASHFNPRSPHGERRDVRSYAYATSTISIHAPRTGSDLPDDGKRLRHGVISIHAPRTGSDGNMNIIGGARWNFNPRSPHGERRKSPKMKLPGTNFNPRSPHGERPAAVCCLCRWRYFNPRSPHGERPGWSILSAIISVFQSTLPARGATFNQSPFAVHASFQSTLPARGATGNRARYWYRCHFNPRSPHGERRYSFLAARRHSSISIHAPRTGSDYFIYQQQSSLLHFNPRSPHGERRQLLE